MTERDVVEEVRGIIAEQMAADRPIAAQWIVHELLRRHDRIYGEDREFALLGCYQLGQRTVKQALRRRPEPVPDDDDGESPTPLDQMILPGYEYLQVAYLVPREGVQQLVRIADMTDEEIEAKAEEKLRLAKGNEQHADELRRYREERRHRSTVA